MINLYDYIANSQLFKTIAVDDLLFVRYECLINDHRSEIWSHSHYFAYVVGGRKKWATPTNEVLVGKEEILFVKKGANTVYQYFEEPFYVIFIFLSDEFISNLLVKYEHVVPISDNPDGNEQDLILIQSNTLLHSFFQSLRGYFSEESQISKELLKLKFEELILTLLTQRGNDAMKSFLMGVCKSRKSGLANIMYKYFAHPLSIMDYARLSARSLASFRRDFKQIYHTPPGRWLLSKRLEYARSLLKTTDLSIDEVMDASGFKNRSHFIKSFKNAYHIPPGRFRNHHAPREYHKMSL